MYKLLNKDIKKYQIINSNKNEIPVIITIPHSGIYLNKFIYDNLLEDVILANTDWYLQDFYSFLEELGFTVIINNISRYVIDPNRDINAKNETNYTNTLIYTKTTWGKEMYKNKPDLVEITKRINNFYIPYHKSIEKEINKKLQHFNKVYLIDLHSFGREQSTDIVLGNNNETTTSQEFINYIEKILNEKNFKVQRNIPYKGGYIVRYHGKNINKCETIQIELSYKSYIEKREFGNEEFPKINKKLFTETQNKMKECFIQLKEEFLKTKKFTI